MAVKEAMAEAHLQGSGLLSIDGDTDLLIALWNGEKHRSIYIRNQFARNVEKSLISKCTNIGQYIFVGSRHKSVRRVATTLARSGNAELLGFNPSYSVYEYTARELSFFLQRAQVTVVNEDECAHICKLLRLRTTEELARFVKGILIVTRGHQGLSLYKQSLVTEVGSMARRPVFSLGAGDALLAGFLHMFLTGASLEDSARFGASMAGLVVESRAIRATISVRQVKRRLTSYPFLN